jgi:hypothetical protein
MDAITFTLIANATEDMTDEERAAFVTTLGPVWDEWVAEFDKLMIDEPADFSYMQCDYTPEYDDRCLGSIPLSKYH